MVYFKINGLGYNCGHTKDNCPQKAQSCRNCIKKRLLELGFECDETLEVIKLILQINSLNWKEKPFGRSFWMF